MNIDSKKRSTMNYIFEFAGIHKSMYIFSVLSALFGVICGIMPYIIIADIIKELFMKEANIKDLLFKCALMAVLWFGRVGFHAISTELSHRATFHVLANIRKNCTDKLGKMSLGAIQERNSGDLKNILVERIDSIETTLAHILPEFTTNLIGAIGILIYLFVIDWRMALVALIPVPIGFICFMFMTIGYDENNKRVISAVKKLNNTAVEYIGGIDVIKVFGKTKNSYERFVSAAQEGARSYIDWMRKCNLFFTFAMVIMPATLVSVLPIGGILVRNGSLSSLDFILIIILSLGLIGPVIACMQFTDDLKKLELIIDEVVSILHGTELTRPEKLAKVPDNHTVHFENVSFSYKQKEVLHNISLTFNQGTVNAIVGPSGSGKSTIAKLIATYWDVNLGAITLGGVDIRNIPSETYNKYIAYVSQDNFLFDETIRENIRMGNLNATDSEIENAAKLCGCHDFIMSLENGYETIVGTGGGHLSGGERQRIAIARAMLKNAPIIILDEATAYTDPENEAVIQSAVAKLIQDKTLIVIAHRLSTITDADCIFVVSDGQIEGSGTHDELLIECDLYRKMWEAHISSKDSEGTMGKGGAVNA